MPVYRADAVLPAADAAAEGALLLPLHQGLDDVDVHTVADEVRKSVEHRTTKP